MPPRRRPPRGCEDVRQIIRSGNGWKVDDSIRKMFSAGQGKAMRGYSAHEAVTSVVKMYTKMVVMALLVGLYEAACDFGRKIGAYFCEGAAVAWRNYSRRSSTPWRPADVPLIARSTRQILPFMVHPTRSSRNRHISRNECPDFDIPPLDNARSRRKRHIS
jgi:hypothetical protein